MTAGGSHGEGGCGNRGLQYVGRLVAADRVTHKTSHACCFVVFLRQL